MSWWGGAGLRTWLWQRISAAYMALFLPAFVIILLTHQPIAFEQWRQWFAHPLMGVASAAFFLALGIHAWVGIRDVVFDYIRPWGLRVIILGLVILLLAFMILWSLRILIMVAA